MVNCNGCEKPITTDGTVRSGAPYHRKCLPKYPWVRPPGCECDASEPRGSKCTAQWMRCKARIAYEMKRRPPATRW